MDIPTVLLLNGAYGVGKTTVAKVLRRRLRGSVLFDPEVIGYVLRRLPRALPGSARGLDDYRASTTWRKAAVAIAAILGRSARPLIVPMTLDRELLVELRDALTSRRCRVEQVCLVASVTTVYARLAKRGLQPSSAEGQWVRSHAAAACVEHTSRDFERRIDTESRTPEEVADEIIASLEGASAGYRR